MTKPIRVGPLMTGCMLAVFLAMLDSQIVTTALPKVVADLGGLDLFGWVTTSYILASSVTAPIYGKVGDLFGRKGVFLVAVGTFLLGSAGCGLAQSMQMLIAFRVVQGVGAGGLFVCVIATIGEHLSPKEGARYFGYFSIAFAGSALAGPLVGGVLTDALGWRSAFFVNVPIGLAALVLITRFLPSSEPRGRVRLDYLGVVLLSVAIVALSLLTSWAGSRYAWTSAQILALAAITTLSAILFVRAEKRASEPLIPLRLFADRTFAVAVCVSAVSGAVFLGSITFLALYLQKAAGASAAGSGLLLLPMMLGLVTSSTISSRLIARTGSYRWYPVASMTIGVVAAVLLSTLDIGTPQLVVEAYLVLFGIAAGLNMQVLGLAAQNTAPRGDLGAVAATVTLSRSLGTSLGISVFAAIFYARLGGETAAPQAYASGLTLVFLIAIPVLLGGLALALRMPTLALRSYERPKAGVASR